MSNEEKILEMLAAMQSQMGTMQSEMKDMHQKIDLLTEGQKELRKDVDELRKGQEERREDLEEVRTSVNALVDWSERVSSIEALNIPRIG